MPEPLPADVRASFTGHSDRILAVDTGSAHGPLLLPGNRRNRHVGCGKTTTALQHADSAVHFDADPQLREIAKVDPGSLLRADPPTLLDEWRLAPEIFGAMRHECDRRAQAGQFILAGSAEPSADPARHAGEGRVLPVRMRTMSLFESGDSDGSVPLRKLLDGDEPLCRGDGLGLEDLTALVCRGGWPQYCELDADDAQTVMRGYVEQLVSAGLPQDADGRFSAGITRAMLRSLARNESTAASLRTLARDAGGNGHPLDVRTAARYLGGLAQLHISSAHRSAHGPSAVRGATVTPSGRR